MQTQNGRRRGCAPSLPFLPAAWRSTGRRAAARAILLIHLALASLCLPAQAGSDTLFLEDFTWTELHAAIASGKTTVLIPVGGVEQSGAHMALGKHNVRVKILAGRIAAELGNAIVAPVVDYVPEGSVEKPTGHMRFSGTISISDAAFKGILEGAARSLRQHGFLNVILIGDHGGYQAQLASAAAELNRSWAGTVAQAWFIEDYYRAASAGYAQILRAKGYSAAQIGTHAGLADTSLMLATDPELVRAARLHQTLTPAEAAATGVAGDPHGASAALGQPGVDLIVTKTVAAIRAALGQRH